jgi:hypothetical protein
MFVLERGQPARSATITLERDLPTDDGAFTVVSSMPAERFAHAFEHTGRAFDALARRMDTARLRVMLDFDRHGLIDGVQVQRHVPESVVQSQTRHVRFLELGDTPAKGAATPEMLVRHLARGFAGFAYTTRAGEYARSISFEVRPTEDWAGRRLLELTTGVEVQGRETLLDGAVALFDRLTQSVGGPGPRSGLRVTLPLKNGEAQTEGASVERLDARFTLQPNRRLANPIRIPAQGDGASEGVNVPSLERELAERFQGMTFHTPEGKPVGRVRLEVRIDSAGTALSVYSDAPEGAFRHAVERYARALERLTRDASDPSKRRWVEIELPLDDQGRVEADGVRVQQL